MMQRTLLSSLLVLFSTGVCLAQAPGSNFLPISVGSGPQTNPTNDPITAWTDTIVSPGVDSVQLHFGVANLQSDGDRLIIQSLQDGARQVFSARTLQYWENHTAWFNGSAVRVSLVLAPGSSGEVTVDRVWMRIPDVPVIETICGPTDNRAVTTDPRVCRVVPSATGFCSSPSGSSPCGASAFMISSTSTVLTARHVAVLSFFSVAEFNVPLSTAAGAIVHPAPDDQYPIDRASIVQSAASVVGDDWAVARLHPNSAGQTAADQQGSFFALAGSLPAVGTTLRITGYGVDDSPDLTRHNSCQTHTGPLFAVVGSTVRYQVDTENANSGSAVRNNTTDQVIAIHTNAGCSDPVAGTSNAGTSILNAGLQAAIAQVTGCASITLNSGSSALVSCTDTIFDIAPAAGRWVGVGVTSASDWDIELAAPGATTTVTSAFGSTTADYLIANGHFGTVDPAAGRLFRNSGTDSARAEFHNSETITIGTPFASSWSSTRVLRLFEFNVTTAGNYDMSVFGDPSLFWRVYSPGTTDAWRERASTTFVVTAGVGGAGASNVALGTGWHCLVVYRNGGVAAPDPISMTVAVCTSGTTTAVPVATATAITDACDRFTVTPSAGAWNVVGIASNSTWAVGLGPAYSGSSSDTQFVVANGFLGGLTPTTGRFFRTAGTASAVAQHVVATAALSLGTNSQVTLGPGNLLEARRFNVTAAGSYEISVTGASGNGLFWRVFEPGTGPGWRPRGDALGSGNAVGNAPVNVTLGTGQHLLVLYRNGAPSATQTVVFAQVCATGGALALPGTSVTTLTGPCQTFTCTPTASEWSVVGVSSASTSDWDVLMGDGASRNGSPITDFVVQNGHLGAASPTGGVFSRFSGADNARGQLGFHVALTTNSSYSANWPADYVVRIFECNVAVTDNYDLRVSNAAELSWRLYAPGSGPEWRSRNSAVVASGTGNGSVSTNNLTPGVYGLVVFRDGGVAAGTVPFDVLFRETPNPVPTITSLSQTFAAVGSASFNLTVTGTNFVPGESVVRWNGLTLATVSSNTTSIVATVPAGFLTTAGIASITVFTPAAGGGSSGTLPFEIRNPLPVLSSISPNTRTAGGAGFTLTLNGSNFNASSVARWNGMNLPTTLVNAGQMTATVAASLIATPGTATITAFSSGPGGGTSVGRTLTINHPVPTLASINPNSVIAGGPGFMLTVNGSNFFNPGSVIRWNGTPLTTTFVNAGQLTATVSAMLVQASGTANVTVFSGAPGGGSSGNQVITLRPPTVSLLGSTSIPVLTPMSAPINLLITGADFLPSAVAYADSTPLPTTFLNSGLLQAQIGPSVPGTLLIGGVAIAVENAHLAPSNARGLAVGGGSNQGTIVRQPLNPFLGEAYKAVLEGAAPFAPMILIADLNPGAPVFPVPDPAANMVLSVRPVAIGQPDWLVLSDTIGLYGAPFGFTYGAGGRLEIPGFVRPNPALGINLTLQGAYIDATSPVGFRLTWARFPDSL